ncbi:MAG: acetate/propionate family kinase [Puia sp.]|nr:acetate/propionate family kinase [Puia sp.]
MILTINGGSSSIKFSLFNEALEPRLKGKIDRIGLGNPQLSYTDFSEKNNFPVKAVDGKEATQSLIDWLEKRRVFEQVKAIGHRIVHGMDRNEPEILDEEALAALKHIVQYDPDHLPGEIGLIEVFRSRYPAVPQVACFDTNFHAGLPRVAQLLPIPRRFDEAGIRRYGFHGLSYSYLMHKLTEIAGAQTAGGRVILAHLGSGASLAAVKEGKSVDTTMGFTPAGGIMMGTRTGDLDPGAAWYMIQREELSAEKFNDLINHRSGLLGVSETSSDAQDLLKNEKTDIRAAEAIELFCYQVRKAIGAFTAVLGGLDSLVFSGGIGENSATIRSRICRDLGYLGIQTDEGRNQNNDILISSDTEGVKIYAIPTDEEWMIAKIVTGFLNLKK